MNINFKELAARTILLCVFLGVCYLVAQFLLCSLPLVWEAWVLGMDTHDHIRAKAITGFLAGFGSLVAVVWATEQRERNETVLPKSDKPPSVF